MLFIVRIDFLSRLASGSTSIDERIANQKVMNVVISYDQAKRLDYAEMEPCKRICAWACDNPQRFFDNFKRELQSDGPDTFWKALDRETADGAFEMASEIIAVLEGGVCAEKEDNAALAKKIEDIKEIAHIIIELNNK